MERKTDLACINLSGSLAVPSSSSDCRYFVPELVANGWLLHDGVNSSQCLGQQGGTLSVGLTPCTATSVWDDRPIQADGLTFPLVNVASGLCQGGTTQPLLESCNNSSGQLCHDNWLSDLFQGIWDSAVGIVVCAATLPYCLIKGAFEISAILIGFTVKSVVGLQQAMCIGTELKNGNTAYFQKCGDLVHNSTTLTELMISAFDLASAPATAAVDGCIAKKSYCTGYLLGTVVASKAFANGIKFARFRVRSASVSGPKAIPLLEPSEYVDTFSDSSGQHVPVHYSPYQIHVDPVSGVGPMGFDTSTWTGGKTLNGGIRNYKRFWQDWLVKYPETLSPENKSRIQGNPLVSPVVDQEWVDHFPEHDSYRGEVIEHHTSTVVR